MSKLCVLLSFLTVSIVMDAPKAIIHAIQGHFKCTQKKCRKDKDFMRCLDHYDQNVGCLKKAHPKCVKEAKSVRCGYMACFNNKDYKQCISNVDAAWKRLTIREQYCTAGYLSSLVFNKVCAEKEPEELGAIQRLVDLLTAANPKLANRMQPDLEALECLKKSK